MLESEFKNLSIVKLFFLALYLDFHVSTRIASQQIMEHNTQRNCEVLWFHFFFGIFTALIGLLNVHVSVLLRCYVSQTNSFCLHKWFGSFVIWSGWLAFAGRWIPCIKPWHKTLGLIYLYGMVVMVYTATWVSYNGFSVRVFIFGWICYGTMIIGHTVIRRFQSNELHIHTVLENVKALQAVDSVEMVATPDGKSGKSTTGSMTAGQTDESLGNGTQNQDDKVITDPNAAKVQSESEPSESK